MWRCREELLSDVWKWKQTLNEIWSFCLCQSECCIVIRSFLLFKQSLDFRVLGFFFFFPKSHLHQQSRWIPISVTVVLFYEKNDFWVYNHHLTQWVLKTFKVNNSQRSWRQRESYNFKLMNKPSMTPPLVLICLTAGANWAYKHKKLEMA